MENTFLSCQDNVQACFTFIAHCFISVSRRYLSFKGFKLETESFRCNTFLWIENAFLNHFPLLFEKLQLNLDSYCYIMAYEGSCCYFHNFLEYVVPLCLVLVSSFDALFFPCYLTSLLFFLQGNWNVLATITVANFKYYLYFDTLGLTIYKVFHSTQAKCNSNISQTMVPMFFSSSCRSFFVKPKSNHLFQCFATVWVLFGCW